jgi:hypothetical protein
MKMRNKLLVVALLFDGLRGFCGCRTAPAPQRQAWPLAIDQGHHVDRPSTANGGHDEGRASNDDLQFMRNHKRFEYQSMGEWIWRQLRLDRPEFNQYRHGIAGNRVQLRQKLG